MFFTIIIPAYNCQNTIEKLLYSIRDQKMKNEIKVIVVDDSDQNHPDLYKYIEPYEKYFPINYYKRENEPYAIHCPGNTRHSGLKKALEEDTEYIMFIDCDDKFKPNTLKTIKNIIINANYPYIVSSRFEVHDMQDKILWIQEQSLGWLHGKCFKKSFLKEHNIQFKIDMETHEDTYFLCEMTYYLLQNTIPNKEIGFDDFQFYIWYLRNDSLSHSEINQIGMNIYLQKHFNDYLSAVLDTFLQNIKRDNITDKKLLEKYYKRCVRNIVMTYHYYQGFVANCSPEYLEQNYSNIVKRIKEFKDFFHTTKEEIIKTVEEKCIDPFIRMRKESYQITKYYVEKESFREFINKMQL